VNELCEYQNARCNDKNWNFNQQWVCDPWYESYVSTHVIICFILLWNCNSLTLCTLCHSKNSKFCYITYGKQKKEMKRRSSNALLAAASASQLCRLSFCAECVFSNRKTTRMALWQTLHVGTVTVYSSREFRWANPEWR